MEGADKEGREKIDSILQKPPPGAKSDQVRSTKEWAPGAQGDNFMAQLAARGGGGRVSVTGHRKVAT